MRIPNFVPILITALATALLMLVLRVTVNSDRIFNTIISSSAPIKIKDGDVETVKNLSDDNATIFNVPINLPQKTIFSGDEIPTYALGSASIDVYKEGYWYEAPATLSNTKLICPNLAKKANTHFCDTYFQSSDHTAHIFAPHSDWKEFNRTLFREALYKIGPIMIVGDSLSYQMSTALSCLLEDTTKSVNDLSRLAIRESTAGYFPPFSDQLRENIELRIQHKKYPTRSSVEMLFSTKWAKTAIYKNVSCKSGIGTVLLFKEIDIHSYELSF